MTSKAKGILKDLIHKLDADTYAKMCNDREDRHLLEGIKNTLSEEMLLPPATEKPDRPLAISFLKACRLQSSYRASVGKTEEILSTTKIETLSKFRVGENPQFSDVSQLADEWGLSAHDLKEVEQAVSHSNGKLEQRRKTVDWFRSLVVDDEGNLDPDKVFRLFTDLFPDHPLQKDQVDLVLTRTVMYWLIPKKSDDVIQNAWLKYYDRFSFNRFINFPMFSGFEVRDSELKFIEDAMQALGLDFHDAVGSLNTTISMQRKEDVEKYIIHDTWGHIWQADLTGFRDLYDEMESLRRPMEASMSVTYPCGDVVCLADLYFPEKGKKMKIEKSEASEFVRAWLDEHTDAILAPLLAEMTADIVEYKFILDNPKLEEIMPSSSVFKKDPAKFDFAWVDTSYFCRELRKIHRVHFKDPSYQESFNKRLMILLKDRYRGRLKDWTEEQISEEVRSATTSLFKEFESIQEAELSNKVEYIEEPNLFYSKLTALLLVQTSANQFIDRQLSCGKEPKEGFFELLVLFIGIAFCDWKKTNRHSSFHDWADTFSRQLSPMLETKSGILNRPDSQ